MTAADSTSDQLTAGDFRRGLNLTRGTLTGDLAMAAVALDEATDVDRSAHLLTVILNLLHLATMHQRDQWLGAWSELTTQMVARENNDGTA